MKFEIGHVLFIDIVGYSKGLINKQGDSLQKLKQIVRGTEQFRIAEAEGKLLRLPTGDGGALVFRNSPEGPVLCAMEIGKALKSYSQFRVRMDLKVISRTSVIQYKTGVARNLRDIGKALPAGAPTVL